VLRQDAARLSGEDFAKKYAPAFFLLHALDLKTADVDVTGETQMASPESSRRVQDPVVYPLRRRGKHDFDYISVGRHEGNDLHMPDSSISRFHAYLRPLDDGWALQDAGSANGTHVGKAQVAKQGEGDPMRIRAGATVRFGDLALTLVTADALMRMATRGR
jgi:hypothetical protein